MQTKDECSQVCRCKKFAETGLPCWHTMATFSKLFDIADKDPHARDWNHFDPKWYSSGYHVAVHTLQYSVHMEHITVIENLQPTDLHSWEIPRPPGRPKKRRLKRKKQASSKNLRKCSSCGKHGHYHTTCWEPNAEYIQNKCQRKRVSRRFS